MQDFCNSNLKTCNMKKTLFVALTILATLNLACEKAEDQINTEPLVSIEAPVPTFAQTQNAEVMETPLNEKSPIIAIIREVNVDLAPNTWYGYFIKREDLPDPMLRKHDVLLIKTNTANVGNPNLYIYGYDRETQTFRLIRSSTKPASETDNMSFRTTDLKSTEEMIYVGAYCFTYPASVRMTTYDRPVNCKEYPTADQVAISLFQPVIGCDGVRYTNGSLARIAGVTSWRLEL